MSDMRLVVMGAAGRMGRMLVRTIGEMPGVTVAAALERAGSDALGKDAGTLAGVGAGAIALSRRCGFLLVFFIAIAVTAATRALF